MSASQDKYKLREMEPTDSADVTRLITEFDGDLTTRFLLDAYTTITSGTENRTVGVVVECAGVEGLAGMGTLRFSRVQYNDEILPLVFLDGLKVHPKFRGQGLGYQIANWRVQQAREAYGDQCVIATGMLQNNGASYAVAKKWCREFIEPALDVLIVPTRKKRPKALTGINVREIESGEYDEFAAGQNRFYKEYNLFPPASASSLAHAGAVSAGGRKPYRFMAALDPNGNLLAGAQTWARGLLKADSLNNPPVPLRLANRVLNFLPADFTLREISVTGFWYEPNQRPAARLLWESLRWHGQDQGTTLAIAFDPRDPAREVIALKPWHQPRLKITVAIHGPKPIDRGKLVFGGGRV
jgi:predicted N-acetyltransferase YhbS